MQPEKCRRGLRPPCDTLQTRPGIVAHMGHAQAIRKCITVSLCFTCARVLAFASSGTSTRRGCSGISASRMSANRQGPCQLQTSVDMLKAYAKTRSWNGSRSKDTRARRPAATSLQIQARVGFKLSIQDFAERVLLSRRHLLSLTYYSCIRDTGGRSFFSYLRG